ncbi:MAG: LysM peptidoglycan-binding domain-containing protein, partial [Candidatus Zixiibacteriota bacterium]
MMSPTKKSHIDLTSSLKLIALVVAILGPTFFAPTDALAKKAAKITYVSHESVYLAAGRNAGLNIGDTLRVKRGRKNVGAVVVTHISTSSAACSVVRGKIKVGDVVSVTGFNTRRKTVKIKPRPRKRNNVWHTVSRGESLSSIARRYNTSVKRLIRDNKIKNASNIPIGLRLKIGNPVAKRSGRSNSNRRLRGMITLQTFFRKDLTANGATRIQPGVGARIRVLNVGGTGAEFRLRHRTRLYYRSDPLLSGASNNEWSHSLYEFSVVYDDASNATNWGFGRVLPAPVRGMGYIDGAYYSR